MNKFVKKLIDEFNKKFKEELKRQIKFFSKPDVLISLGIATLVLLNKLVKEQKSKIEIKTFLQKDAAAKSIIKYTQLKLDDDILDDIVIACISEKEPIIPEITEEINVKTLLSFADKTSDIDNKLNIQKFNSISKTLEGNVELFVTYTFLLHHIIDMTKDLLTKTEYPSKYRLKYIQKLTRNVYGIMTTQIEAIKINKKQEYIELKEGTNKIVSDTQDAITNKYNKIRSALKQIDNILIAIALATTIYIINRKNLQKKSKETLSSIAKDVICTEVSEPFDVSINKIPLAITLNCPVIMDDVIVPHIPISIKMENLSCEVPQNEQLVPDASESIDLVTHAVIRNISQKTLIPLVTKDAHLTTESQMANLQGKFIYCPVDGTIESLNKNEIVLRDISDAQQDYLSKQIDLLNEKYERYNGVKSFLKNYFVESLYPSMLAIAIVDDTSTRNRYTKVENQWEDLKDIYKMVNKEYEKQVKKITGKNNVEKHAENETLDVIKTDLEKQEEIFFKHLELINENAIDAAKKTKARSSEYELIEYYLLDLGAMFNQLEQTDKIETEFKDNINEFIRRRIIIDGYNKNKIVEKINDVIKNIEKGISVGNWFTKAMEIYTQSKKLDDVESWLAGLAQKNKKLEGAEKDNAVNKVMFLFELYLNYDEIIKKYNIINKETTHRSATIEEGNWIFAFTQQLWKDYKSFPKEIEEIQKTIDSLSMFQTYSIIMWNGYQARLYTIADEPTCVSTERDPYLNPKTAYGFADIQYWLKYCAAATLASCANPATGWSTGWIFPTPILFPVVYIPIKAIYTKYGFMVIGLSICGIYLFPWVLFVNFTTQYTTPFGDPTVLLKKQIEKLKKEISERLIDLKKTTIKPLLDKSKENVRKTEEELEIVKQQQKDYIQQRPERLTVDPNNIEAGVIENPKYVSEYFDWAEKNRDVAKKVVDTQVSLWRYEAQAMALQESYTYGKSLVGILGVTGPAEQLQLTIGKQIDQLLKQVDNVNSLLAVLPIAIAPESANFAITIKNPKPIIKIKDNLEDMIDAVVLDNVVEKFRLKSEDLTSSKYLNKLIFSVVNDKVYRRALSAAKVKIIIQDAFPKYESLTVTNYPWLMFLYKDFVTTGAKTYGFPGNLPLPI
jgi:hypothetical protein